MASRVGDKQIIVRQETGADEDAEPQITLKDFPSEILQLIFVYAGPKACGALGFVCKGFYQLAFDKRIWRPFCLSLGYPASVILSRVGVDCRRDYPRLRDLATNLRNFRYLEETTDNCIGLPQRTSFDLCYFDHDKYGEVHNVWTKEREFSILPEPNLVSFFKEMSQTAARGIALIDSEETPSPEPVEARNELEVVIQTLKSIDKRFWDLKPWIASLSLSEPAQTKNSLERIKTFCEMLSAIYPNDFPYVSEFAANEAFCVMGFDDLIEVWDRSKKVKLASILNSEEVDIGFLPNCVCIHGKESRTLSFYDFEKGLESSLENVDLFQVLSDNELLILNDTALIIRNLQTNNSQELERRGPTIYRSVFEKQTGLLATHFGLPTLTGNLNQFITILRLTPSESSDTPSYSKTKVGMHALPPLQSIKWREGSLYATTTDSSLMKIELDDSKPTVKTLLTKHKNFNGRIEFTWEGDKLHLLFIKEQGNLVPHRLTINFFITESEIIKDLAVRYRKDSYNTPHLDHKFSSLRLNVQQGIFSYLPAIDPELQGNAEEWKIANSQTKAGAMELYLNRSPFKSK